MRIAVCDDCPEDAFSLKSKLTMHEVTVYSGASDLLTDIEGGKQLYDLYLLDIYMDNALLEVFVNHGEYAFTRRYEHYKTDYQIEAELSTGCSATFCKITF